MNKNYVMLKSNIYKRMKIKIMLILKNILLLNINVCDYLFYYLNFMNNMFIF